MSVRVCGAGAVLVILLGESTDLEHVLRVLKANVLGSKGYPSATLPLHCAIPRRPVPRCLVGLWERRKTAVDNAGVQVVS